MKLSVQYNAPFILTFSFITALFFLFDSIFNNGLSASLGLNLPTSIPLISNVTYVFCHANMEHLFANLSFILLLGPILEEKYGIAKMSMFFLITTIVTAIFHNLFFTSGLIGASGLVFMLILLISFAGNQHGKIPLTFILVALLYIGREIVAAMETDQISQFGHIMGGIVGAVLGFIISGSGYMRME